LSIRRSIPENSSYHRQRVKTSDAIATGKTVCNCIAPSGLPGFRVLSSFNGSALTTVKYYTTVQSELAFDFAAAQADLNPGQPNGFEQAVIQEKS